MALYRPTEAALAEILKAAPAAEINRGGAGEGDRMASNGLPRFSSCIGTLPGGTSNGECSIGSSGDSEILQAHRAAARDRQRGASHGDRRRDADRQADAAGDGGWRFEDLQAGAGGDRRAGAGGADHGGVRQGGDTMSGLRSRRKDARVELAVAKLIGARKVSRAYQAGHDLELLLGEDRMLRIECKARADGFRQLYDWLDNRDILIVKSDRQEPLVVVRLSLAAKIATRTS